MSWFMASIRKSMRMWTWIGRSPARAMPIAAPVMASSDRAVPTTRSEPYFSTRPRVVPWMALGSSTSRPKTTTDGSRAISWSAASRTASTQESVRGSLVARAGRIETACSMALLLENVAGQLLGPRERAGLGEGEGVGNLVLDGALDPRPLLRFDQFSQAREDVGGQQRLRLVRAAKTEVVVEPGADVLAPAVGHHLQECRTATGTD